MRIAVLSDVHANLPALDAVLGAIGEIDEIWHLGDLVGYGPHPNEVIARLSDRGAQGVRGNHDAAALGGLEIEAFNVDARRAMEWTRTALSQDTRAWLDGLPDRRTYGDFTLVHGSPRDPAWEYVTSAPIARAGLALCPTPHCLNGHTHLPVAFREDDGRLETLAPADLSTIPLDARRVMLNPGSVGQPRDGDPRASWLEIDTEQGQATWRRVAYPIAATQAAMRSAGLPERLITRLDQGL